MTIAFTPADTASLAQTEGTLVVLVGSDGALSGAGGAADAAMGGALKRAIASPRFKGKHGEAMEFPFPAGMKADRLIIASTGKDPLDATTARHLGGKIAAKMGKLETPGATVHADGLDAALTAELAAGMKMRRYAFNRYKTGKDADTLGKGSITVATADTDAAKAAFTDADALAEGTFFTRDLVSEPANVLYPESFAARLEALSELGVEVTVMREKELEEIGMGSLLCVGLGSPHESTVVVMKWMGGAEGDAPFCAVGKGVTFDTGGISIKPAGGMEEMTMDMGGAGVVSGLMKTVALRKAKANVIGIVGLVENMPDGLATRPGDIVTSLSGKTIEVINTDAEGRLVLADILFYAQREFKPAATVNLATLTGAIIIALGNTNAGLFCNNDDFATQIADAADAESEGIWRMPLAKEYDDLIKSSLADIKNTGGRAAGSITAAQFLQRFVNDSPWAHIDIAGVTLSKEAKPLHGKGASGWGVATLNRLVRDNFEK